GERSSPVPSAKRAAVSALRSQLLMVFGERLPKRQESCIPWLAPAGVARMFGCGRNARSERHVSLTTPRVSLDIPTDGSLFARTRCRRAPTGTLRIENQGTCASDATVNLYARRSLARAQRFFGRGKAGLL